MRVSKFKFQHGGATMKRKTTGKEVLMTILSAISVMTLFIGCAAGDSDNLMIPIIIILIGLTSTAFCANWWAFYDQKH